MLFNRKVVIFFIGLISLFSFYSFTVAATAGCTGSGGSCISIPDYCTSIPNCLTYLLPDGNEVCAGGAYTCDSISDSDLCESVGCTWDDGGGGGGGGREMCPADRCVVDTQLIDFPVIESAERDYGYDSCLASAQYSDYCNAFSHDECSTFSCGGIYHVCTYNHIPRFAPGWSWFSPYEVRETDFCGDGLDNDCDGDTDEEDSDCGSNDYCALSGVTTDVTGCSGIVCKHGENVVIRGSLSGDGCTDATRFQVNFMGDDCEVRYQGGDLSGVYGTPSIVGTSVSATWTVPVVLGSQCEGEMVTAQSAELWDGTPLMLSRTTDVLGTITFEGTAGYAPCTSVVGWKTKDITHASCTGNLVSCVRDSEDGFGPLTLGLYDQYCDTDNTIKNIQIGYVGGEF